jgi:hypothetical protein
LRAPPGGSRDCNSARPAPASSSAAGALGLIPHARKIVAEVVDPRPLPEPETVTIRDLGDEHLGLGELVSGDAERLAKREPFLAQSQPARMPQ